MLAPNGDLITTNGDAFNTMSSVPPSEMVEFTQGGKFVASLQLDSAAGGAFGLALNVNQGTITLAAVDDNVPALFIWLVP